MTNGIGGKDQTASRHLMTKHCKQCGKEFVPKWSKEATFCSGPCRIKWIKRNDQIRIDKRRNGNAR